MSLSKALYEAKGTPEFQKIIDRKRGERMAKIDAMTPELRECVNIYGLSVVNACMALGIVKAKHIRHLVETVLDEFSPTRGSSSKQGSSSQLSRIERS